MSWEDGGPLDPPEEVEISITCPTCHAQNTGCPRCNGDGVIYGDAVLRHLEDLRERAADRKLDR